MKRFKKLKLLYILTLLVTFVMCTNVLAEESSDYQTAIDTLVKMDIMSSAEKRIFKTNENITRAEFTRLFVKSLGKDDEANLLKQSTVFSDVNANHKEGGYINYAVKNNLITGYADGSFRPEEPINFAQAITVMLRGLGYASADIGGIWPQNYIQKAYSLEITKGITFNPNDYLTKGNAAILLEKTLGTTKRSSDKTLAEEGKIGVTKTVIVLNSWEVDKTVQKNVVKTDLGDFKADKFNGIKYLGQKVNILVDENNNILSVQKLHNSNKVVFVNSIVGDKINYSDEKGVGSLAISDSMTVYYKGTKSIFKDVKKNVNIGSIISFGYNRDYQYDYAAVADFPVSDPEVIREDININVKKIGNIDISKRENITVIRDGKNSSFAELKIYDVVYFIKNPFVTNKGILLAYDKKVTGLYDEAIPAKNAVVKIKLSGTEYEIGTDNAASRLNDSSASFDIDDELTLLLGIDGKIIDAISPSSADTTNIGIVINTRKGLVSPISAQNKDYYYVKLFKPDGTIVEYKTIEDYADSKGKIVRYYNTEDGIEIKDADIDIIYGSVDKFERKLGEHWLSSDISILDMNYQYSSEVDVAVKKLQLRDLPSSLVKDNVIASITGGPFGDIKLLVLNNITKFDQYGIITKKDLSKGLNYSILSNGNTFSYTSNSTFLGTVGDIVSFEQNGSASLTQVQMLGPAEISDEIQAVDRRRIRINNKIYILAYDVQIYDISKDTPVRMNVESLTAGKLEHVAIFKGIQANSTNTIKVITLVKE